MSHKDRGYQRSKEFDPDKIKAAADEASQFEERKLEKKKLWYSMTQTEQIDFIRKRIAERKAKKLLKNKPQP